MGPVHEADDRWLKQKGREAADRARDPVTGQTEQRLLDGITNCGLDPKSTVAEE